MMDAGIWFGVFCVLVAIVAGYAARGWHEEGKALRERRRLKQASREKRSNSAKAAAFKRKLNGKAASTTGMESHHD